MPLLCIFFITDITAANGNFVLRLRVPRARGEPAFSLPKNLWEVAVGSSHFNTEHDVSIFGFLGLGLSVEVRQAIKVVV